MLKLVVPRVALAVLLVALGLLLTACGQGSAPGPTAQTSNAQATGTPAANLHAGSTPDGSLPSTLISAEATATILAGQEGNATAPPGGIDLTKLNPCSLLTGGDVKGAMGDVPFAPKLQDQTSQESACSYVEPTLEVNSPRLFLTINSPDYWELHTAQAEDVSGIGDAAQTYLFDGWRTLWVLLNNRAVVQIDIYPSDLDKAEQLASIVIKKLP